MKEREGGGDDYWAQLQRGLGSAVEKVRGVRWRVNLAALIDFWGEVGEGLVSKDGLRLF
jgi:hypothetical protein